MLRPQSTDSRPGLAGRLGGGGLLRRRRCGRLGGRGGLRVPFWWAWGGNLFSGGIVDVDAIVVAYKINDRRTRAAGEWSGNKYITINKQKYKRGAHLFPPPVV